MPAAVATPPQHVLADSTNTRRNFVPALNSGKKRRHDGSPVTTLAPTRRLNGSAPGSSQPKSQFEAEVLEKLTQNIGGLKNKNAEKDQQWERPPLDDFDERTQNLCFQQIEAEEGTLHGGKTTVKLFGTTEVSPNLLLHQSEIANPRLNRTVTLSYCTSPTSITISTSQLPAPSTKPIAKASRPTSRRTWLNTNLPSTLFSSS